MKEKGIEELFKSAFDNFEADVDPQVWTNVQSQINAPVTSPSGYGNGSIAGKAGALAGKLGAKAIIGILTAVTNVSVGTYLLVNDSESSKFLPPTEQTLQAPELKAVSSQPVPATSEQSATTANTIVEPQVSKAVTAQPQKAIATKENKPEVPTPIKNIEVQPLESSPTAATSGVTAAAAPAPVKADAQPSENAAQPASTKGPEVKPAENAKPEEHVEADEYTENSYLQSEGDAVSERILLPNIFTPNGDGLNDELKIKAKNLQSLTVTIFDKFGKIVYKWTGLDGRWDGNLADGSAAPAGHYYYLVAGETTDGAKCTGRSILIVKR